MANMKKLDDEARMRIQAYLAKGYKPSIISKDIGFSVSTVYRELERASAAKNAGAPKCPELQKSKAAVCNCCRKRGFCSKEKRYYDWARSFDEAMACAPHRDRGRG